MGVFKKLLSIPEGFSNKVLKPVSEVVFPNLGEKTVLDKTTELGLDLIYNKNTYSSEEKNKKIDELSENLADIGGSMIGSVGTKTASAFSKIANKEKATIKRFVYEMKKSPEKFIEGHPKFQKEGLPLELSVRDIADKLGIDQNVLNPKNLADTLSSIVSKPAKKTGAITKEIRTGVLPKEVATAKPRYRFLNKEDKKIVEEFIDEARLNPKDFSDTKSLYFKDANRLETDARELAKYLGIDVEKKSISKLADLFELIVRGSK